MPPSFGPKQTSVAGGWVFRALQNFYTWYMELVLKTTRWEFVGFEQADADLARGIPRIYCLWHARLALMPYFRRWEDHPMATFVSQHRDAQIATGLMRKRQIQVIAVHTSGGKTGPVRAAVRLVRGGSSLGITPDGPFGPRYVVQPGAVLIASLGQVRLSPVAFSTHRRIVLRTWDRFVLPLPFGRGAFVMAEGDIPPPGIGTAEMAEMQTRLGDMIDAVSTRADQIVDRKP